MTSRLCIGALLLSSLTLMGTSACVKNRFLACETDPDCASEEPGGENGKPFCQNLRCVQCRTTADCGPAEACNRKTSRCDSLR